MNILSIETSCDDTGIAFVSGSLESGFSVLGSALSSQVNVHAPYGGVFPSLAKREHAKNLIPLLAKLITETNIEKSDPITISSTQRAVLGKYLVREPVLLEKLLNTPLQRPCVDAIAVTTGPGLAPALWVGINCARALSTLWDIPVIAINHMEGHIVSVLTQEILRKRITFPAIALLISGGHTELVLTKAWGDYTILGETRDDAVGEAFDKVGRILGLPYPGGPGISRLAQLARNRNKVPRVKLPRPMIHSDTLDFSFSGLKTAVLYTVKKRKLTEQEKEDIAHAFENAVTDVLLAKTKRALIDTNAQTLIIAGGVAANTYIRQSCEHLIQVTFPCVTLAIPTHNLSTDNAVMIGTAALIALGNNGAGAYTSLDELLAEGNLTFRHLNP